MNLYSSEEKECPRCKHIKKLENFLNKRKVIGKYCIECLEKKRKYCDDNRCEKHNRVKTSCPGCKIEKEAKEGKVFKPMKTKTKEIKVDENGQVTVIYTKK